jgi:hypothetical protein
VLTQKEIEVLRLRKRGLKQSEIALRLKISQAAVSDFLNNALKKIQNSIDTLDLVKELGLDMKKFKRGKP